MNDRDAERLLAGHVSADDPELGAVASFLDTLDESAHRTSTGHCETAHLTLMLDTVHLLQAEGEPQPAEPDEQRSRKMIGWLKPWWAKVGVGAAGLVLASTGLAFAGALPDPIQSGAADTLEHVGITVENPAEEAAEAAEAEAEAAAEAQEAVEDAAQEAADRTSDDIDEANSVEADDSDEHATEADSEDSDEHATEADSEDSDEHATASHSDSDEHASESDSGEHTTESPSTDDEHASESDSGEHTTESPSTDD